MPKKGNIWLVVKYKKSNDITISDDSYYITWMEVAKEKMGRAKIFSTVDLRKGYYQVPLNDWDKERSHSQQSSGSTSLKSCRSG